MKPRLTLLLKEFHELPKAGQDSLLKDLYNLSDEAHLLIANRLIGQADFSDLIRKMKRETVDKVYRKGMPGTPNGRVVNGIISSAKKARAPVAVLLELEQLAYRGFIEFLHEYGGGPDSFLDLGPKHLEAYLTIVKQSMSEDQQAEVFENVRKYLLRKDNTITDYVDEVFRDITGMHVR
jgi:hypothetical protein